MDTQLLLFNTEAVRLTVRTGTGTIRYSGEELEEQFTDKIKTIWRVPRDHTGWQSIKYKGKRYQLFGGIRTEYFICLNSPI